MTPPAEARALWARLVVRRRDQFSPEELRRPEARVPDQVLVRARSALPFAWLPAEDALTLADANASLLGERYIDESTAHLVRELLRPPLGSLLRGLVMVSGDEMRAVAAILEYCYGTVLRNCGDIVVNRPSSTSLQITHATPHPRFVQSHAYRGATFVRATLAIVGVAGEVGLFEEEDGNLVCEARALHPTKR